jgi:hypothetical protein
MSNKVEEVEYEFQTMDYNSSPATLLQYILCSFSYLKTFLLWILDSLTIRFTFDDLMMMLTLFVLFGTDINQLAAAKQYDHLFNVLYSISFGFFLFELIANTIAKTDFASMVCLPYAPPGPPPKGREGWDSLLGFMPYFPLVKFNGYMFSFYWWLDVASIVSLFPDVLWIAKGLDIDSATGSSNLSRGGRVLRLVRLVRLLRLYKIAVEKIKKAKIDAELVRMVEEGVIEYKDMEVQRAINEARTSQLSTQLSSSTTRKVIVLILILLIILPLLQYNPSNRKTIEYAVGFLHTFNSANMSMLNASTMLALESMLKYTTASWQPFQYSVIVEMQPFYDGYAKYSSSSIHETRR